MAYSTSNPPARIAGTVGSHSVWFYPSADDDATVNGADYFSNGDDLGMKVGDVVYVYETDTKTSVCYVSAVTSGGAATTAFAAVA